MVSAGRARARMALWAMHGMRPGRGMQHSGGSQGPAAAARLPASSSPGASSLYVKRAALEPAVAAENHVLEGGGGVAAVELHAAALARPQVRVPLDRAVLDLREGRRGAARAGVSGTLWILGAWELRGGARSDAVGRGGVRWGAVGWGGVGRVGRLWQGGSGGVCSGEECVGCDGPRRRPAARTLPSQPACWTYGFRAGSMERAP